MDKSKTSNRAKLALGGLGFAVAIFFAVNIFANAALKGQRLDLTEDRLFTLSEGTSQVISSIDEPITVRLYFSKALGEVNPRLQTYFNRIRDLLDQYANISEGKLRFELYNPEPFTEDEDRAVAFGLQGVPINNAGDRGYFGLVTTNSTDDQETIGYLNPRREAFLEYDLTRMIQGLVNPEPKTIGILSGIPINGIPMAQQPRWAVVDQIADFFDVRNIEATEMTIPEEVDILLIAHPKQLNELLLYAIDQFVLKGGPALIFNDPNSEVAIAVARGAPGAGVSDLGPLLKAWGVALEAGKVVGDLDTARRVNVRRDGQIAVADYVVWLSLDKRNFNTNDPITSNLNRVNVASAGSLVAADGATTKLTPLITTKVRAARIDAEKVRMNPDVVALFREFKPEGKPLTIAARVQGLAKSAYPDGRPKPDKEKQLESVATHMAAAKDPINVIVVSDADLLHDQFWVEQQDLFGQNYQVPFASNADLVLNALENLAGGSTLVGLRSRGETTRPFSMVLRIRQDAELKYRAKEQELVTKLKQVQQEMTQLVSQEENGGEATVTTADRQAIENRRREMISIRRQLRDVQHALREDIDNLDMLLKFLNIVVIPLLLGVATLVLILFRRVRHRAA